MSLLLLLLSRSVVSDSVQPHGLQPTRLLHPWDFQARLLEWVAIAFSIWCLVLFILMLESNISKSCGGHLGWVALFQVEVRRVNAWECG